MLFNSVRRRTRQFGWQLDCWRTSRSSVTLGALRARTAHRTGFCRRSFSSNTGTSQTTTTGPRSRLSTFASRAVFGLTFAGLGYFVSLGPVLYELWGDVRPISDEESRQLYTPGDSQAAAVEAFINKHPLAIEMRNRPEMRETRPHMKFPDVIKRQNLTAGTLLGPGRVTVPPFAWSEEGGKSLVTIMHLGTDMCGHPGIVHGGLLATLLDEGLARCCFDAVPNKVAVTAKLEINYRKPTKAGQYVVLRAETKKVEGRKAWVEGRIETLAENGQPPVVLAEATGLFVSPNSSLAKLIPKLQIT